MAKRGILDGYKTYDTSGGFGNPDKWRKTFKDRMTEGEAQELLQHQTQTPYQILGLPDRASQAEIKAAFRRLITEWHPDKNQHRLTEAEERSKQIIAAYTILNK